MAGAAGLRVGIALGEGRAVAVVLGRKGAPIASVEVPPGAEGASGGAGLGEVFEGLKSALEGAGAGSSEGARAFVALLPPLVDARVIPLPPLRRQEVEAVLTRDVSRHFLGANRPRVVAVRLPGGNGSPSRVSQGGSVPVLAAAAPVATLDAVRRAVAGVGWRLVSLHAAHGAWWAAAKAVRGAPVEAVLAVVGETAHLLMTEGAEPGKVRQLPARDLAVVAEALGQGSGQILVLSSPQAFDELRGPLSRGGRAVARDPEGWSGAEEAAAARVPAGNLELVPPSLAMERRVRARGTALRLAGAAVILLLATAGGQLWGAHRELAAVQAQRSEIRSRVTPLLALRDTLTELTGRVESMDSLTRSSPLWTRSLVDLTGLLPSDSYLTGFFASGDTLELEAAGGRAGEAIQTLRQSGLFQEVRLQGLVERELAEGETVVERFRLWARLPSPEKEGGV